MSISATDNINPTVGQMRQNFKLVAPSPRYHAMAVQLDAARTAFVERYVEARPDEADEAGWEFMSRLMETTAMVRDVLEKRLGTVATQVFLAGIEAWHAVNRSGLPEDAPITCADLPDRIRHPDGVVPCGSLQRMLERIIDGSHPLFAIEPARPVAPSARVFEASVALSHTP